MRILIYKRTHIGDPNYRRQFGHAGCMGRVRGFTFDAVIGVGGVGSWPTQQGIAGKINWVGRRPRKSQNPIDSRGPLASFTPNNFRLFEHRGPLLADEAPLLAKRIFGNTKTRFLLRSLTLAEKREAQRLIRRILDLREFDHLQLTRQDIDKRITICRKPFRARYETAPRIVATHNPTLHRTCTKTCAAHRSS